MQDYISIESSQVSLNSSLKFYYLDLEEKSEGYDIYQGGGYVGFTPSSWNSSMGLFTMFKRLKQDDENTKKVMN